VRCDSAHAVELLGWTSLGSSPVVAAEVREVCSIYAARALRTADPTGNGVIRPEIVASHREVATIPPTNADLADSSVACALTVENGRQLNDTLVGIGQRPLPLV
jgi:hypothetical protein